MLGTALSPSKGLHLAGSGVSPAPCSAFRRRRHSRRSRLTDGRPFVGRPRLASGTASAAGQLEPEGPTQRPLDDGGAGAGAFEPDRVGRSAVRHDRDQQPGERDVQAGPLRRGDASEDRSMQRWVVMALDRRTGAVRWQQTATRCAAREASHQGDLRQRYARHRRSTCGGVLRLAGPLRVRHGRPPAVEQGSRSPEHRRLRPSRARGTASSPIIYKNLVIVQCDTQNEFVLAADIDTGATVWKTVRRNCRPGERRPSIQRRTDGQPS